VTNFAKALQALVAHVSPTSVSPTGRTYSFIGTDISSPKHACPCVSCKRLVTLVTLVTPLIWLGFLCHQPPFEVGDTIKVGDTGRKNARRRSAGSRSLAAVAPFAWRITAAADPSLVALPAARLQIGRHAHLVGTRPSRRLDPQRPLEDFAYGYISKRS
jgi:hypothetical protein